VPGCEKNTRNFLLCFRRVKLRQLLLCNPQPGATESIAADPVCSRRATRPMDDCLHLVQSASHLKDSRVWPGTHTLIHSQKDIFSNCSSVGCDVSRSEQWHQHEQFLQCTTWNEASSHFQRYRQPPPHCALVLGPNNIGGEQSHHD
jgi:hypothetical protein